MLYEFRQGVRFQVWLHAWDKSRGYGLAECDRASADLRGDLETGALVVVAADWPDVHRFAESLSKRRTSTGGHQSLDVLHIATALHLGARDFLTFDVNQRKLASAEKLKARP